MSEYEKELWKMTKEELMLYSVRTNFLVARDAALRASAFAAADVRRRRGGNGASVIQHYGDVINDAGIAYGKIFDKVHYYDNNSPYDWKPGGSAYTVFSEKEKSYLVNVLNVLKKHTDKSNNLAQIL